MKTYPLVVNIDYDIEDEKTDIGDKYLQEAFKQFTDNLNKALVKLELEHFVEVKYVDEDVLTGPDQGVLYVNLLLDTIDVIEFDRIMKFIETYETTYKRWAQADVYDDYYNKYNQEDVEVIIDMYVSSVTIDED